MFSTGGDGLNTNCYTQDAQIQADLIQSGRILEPALDAFTQSTHGALKAIGKTPVVWEGKGCQSLTAINPLTWVYRNGIHTQCGALRPSDCNASRRLLQGRCENIEINNRVWVSSQNVAAVAGKQLMSVHAPSDYFYLASILPSSKYVGDMLIDVS